MLIQLNIRNLILVEKAEIVFEKGLNILTGETGAGKSAILSAIRLIAGERADPGLIGKHGEIAIVEATLSTYILPDELEKPPPGSPLIIRREISKSGKNRCFANDQQITLNTLRQIVGHTIEIVDQSSSHLLSSHEAQRNILDTYCETLPLLQKLEVSFRLQRDLEQRKEALAHASETRTRDLEWAEVDLELIEEVNWKPDEDEKLRAEHHLLTHSTELLEKIDALTALLSEIPLKRASHLLDTCANLDPFLKSPAGQFRNASLEIEEVSRVVHSYLNRLETDPNQLEKVEKRIAQIEHLKKRFGKTFEQVEIMKKELQHKVETLKNLDQEILEIDTQCVKKTIENEALALAIREKRQKHAPSLSKAILSEIHTLNLPNAQFTIDFQQLPLAAHGMDAIRFLFSANVGHTPVPINECASGGELSRLLFSMKVILSSKENNSCLIFDEIDSNVGGQTASILGEKLKRISNEKQVICVTHFVQVARLAQTHFAVKKLEELGKTQIHKLNSAEKHSEYERMLGTR